MLGKTKTLQLSRIQFRLACELAAAEAARLEYQRQISAQMPGCDITIANCPITIKFCDWPTSDTENQYVFEWID